jgi:hypothetical protein
LSAACLSVVILGGLHLQRDGQFDAATPDCFIGVYLALKQNGNLVALILGFSNLAWTRFFQVSNRIREGRETPPSN